MDVCKRISVPTVAALALAGTVACADPGVVADPDASYDNSYIEELAEALGSERLFEPRLSGGFQWGECIKPDEEAEDLIPSALCGTLEAGSPEWDRVLRVWTRILDAAERGETADLLHAQGVGHLLWSADGGDDPGKQIDWAIDKLTQARELAAEGSEQWAAILNDLAVAYRVQAGREGRALDLIAALEAAEEVHWSGTRRPEALFNRALLLDDLALRGVAESAWSEYLSGHDERAWQLEGEQRAEQELPVTPREQWDALYPGLERAALAGTREALQPIVASAPMLVWSYAQHIWLPEWADSYLEGAATLDAKPLILAREVGWALDALGVGSSVHDAVAAIIESAAESERLQSLALGHSAYGQGYRIQRWGEAGDLCEAYQRAEQHLEAADSSFALWARLSVAEGCFLQTDQRTALAKLETLSRATSYERYPALAGRIEWLKSLATGSQGRFEQTLAHALEAQKYFERSRDQDLPSALTVVSDGYRSLGLLEKSWSARLRSLQGFLRFQHLHGYHNALTGGIYALFDAERYVAVGPWIEELLLVVGELTDPEYQAYAQALWARYLSEMGLQSQASDALEAGNRFVDGIQREDLQRQVGADLTLERARIEMELDPQKARTSATRAFRALTSAGRQVRLPELHLLQAKTHAALGEIETAEKQFRLAFEELERRRDLSLSEGNRISFFEAFQDSIDEILSFYVNRGRVAEAFQYAERSRSRALLDRVLRAPSPGGDGPTPTSVAYPEGWTLQELQKSLWEDEVVLEFAVLPDRLVTWVVRRDLERMIVRDISAHELGNKVHRFRELLESFAPEKDVLALAGDLYDLLIAPVAELLTQDDHLLMAPDRFLHRIPFAALHDRADGAFLIEKHPLSVLPSTSLLAANHSRSPWPESPDRMTVLAVAPKTDGQASLPWSEQEARDVSQIFPRTSLLLGGRATKEAVLELLPQHEIVHFATHADYREGAPLQSTITLSPNGGAGEESRLTAREIYGLDLSGTRLVVLAACQTTDAYPGSGREGVAGWARAFFAAGVPRVVAGLWALEDRDSRQLMLRFHRHLSAESPAWALRNAQVALIERGYSPYRWAQLQMYWPP